ncbi:MAG: alpha/beta hydrolase [Cytophagaceae bacterium]|nr:alpha/beta hydrolase [Cytophagaceae bacterium]
MKELTFPVFQIIGVYDTFVTFQDALSQSVLPKKPNVLLLDDVAHAGMLESPQMCADFINNFLSKIA